MSRKAASIFVFSLILLFCFTSLAEEAGREEKMQEELNRIKTGCNDSPFGALEFLNWDHPWNSHKYHTKKALEKSIALMKKAGIGMVRMDFLWQEIEPEPGRFQFERYDALVDLLAKNNIAILGLLDYSPDWASSCARWNCPPKDNRLFVNYAVWVVERYRGKIKYWELWNEPDSRTYWEPQDGLKAYCTLLAEVYTALKKADPECKILNGGLTNGISSINRLYDNGAKDYFDILNIHIFESPLEPGAVKRVGVFAELAYKIMARNGDAGKKIWVTEIGCPGVKPGVKIQNWWRGANPNEEKQAEWVKSVFTQLLKDKNIEKVFWAFFRDCKDHWYNGVDYFGLVRWDYSKKPSFSAYKECYRNWRRPK